LAAHDSPSSVGYADIFSQREKSLREFNMSHHNPLSDEQKTRIRHLRRDATFPERLLWGRLRAGRLAGFKFRRQHAVGPYILDFYCHERLLALELDGDSHAGRAQYDSARTEYLMLVRIRVLRIANDDVLGDLDAVTELILRECGVR
jgi:very-short-patch-repair endonuclease